RVRHRHAISLRGEDVAGQQVGRLEVLRLRKRVPAAEVCRQALAQLFHRVVALQARAQLRGEEAPRALRQAETRQVREKRVARVLEAVAEKRLQILERLRLHATEVGIQAPQQGRAPRG